MSFALSHIIICIINSWIHEQIYFLVCQHMFEKKFGSLSVKNVLKLSFAFRPVMIMISYIHKSCRLVAHKKSVAGLTQKLCEKKAEAPVYMSTQKVQLIGYATNFGGKL